MSILPALRATLACRSRPACHSGVLQPPCKFNTAFTCSGRGGGHCTPSVALERDIELHMDAEGEIAREQVQGET